MFGLPLATLESSLYRTVATHRVLGSSEARDYTVRMTAVADDTFYLDLPEEQRLARLEARDGPAPQFSSHWDELLHERQDDLRQEYAGFGLLPLDASLAIDALVGQVRARLEV